MPAIAKHQTMPAELATPSATAVGNASAMRANVKETTKDPSVKSARLALHHVSSLRKTPWLLPARHSYTLPWKPPSCLNICCH